MKLKDAFEFTVLGKTHLVAGKEGLGREIRWVHIVDMPDIVDWVSPGQLLLTTGYAWPRDEASQRALVRSLAAKNLAGVGLAVPRFFDHFPAAFCDEADQHTLPLLEIPWEIPFTSITEELHTAILAEQLQLLEQSEKIHRTLTQTALEASSLQDIAQALGSLIHHAVTFEDQEGRILGAYNIPGTEDRIRRETLASGFTPVVFLDYLEQTGYKAQIDSARSPIRIPPVPALDFVGRIVCPIRLKGELVGRVWIIEGSTPLSELELRAAEHAAMVAALQIAHQRAIASMEARVGYSFLTTILEGRFEATPQAVERAQLHGLVLEGCYRVGIFVMDEPLPLSHEGLLKREAFAEALRHQLQRIGAAPLVSVSMNQIQFLLAEHLNPEQLWQRVSQTSVALGVSRAYRGIEGVREAYLEVLGMLPHLSWNRLQRYEALLLPRVLSGESAAQQAFVESLFAPLRNHKNGDVLIETLVAFAQSGFHLRRTADALNIHPKSLRYRLERAAELGGWNLHDPETRFQLQLATHIRELQKAFIRTR
ncbi:MAG: PucR family transcriptional regulator ligand-binding domain-containing protein [bacterium]|nr:PucR family transcriptional regulator ligand-binding domain-containing protein [bacterium]